MRTQVLLDTKLPEQQTASKIPFEVDFAGTDLTQDHQEQVVQLMLKCHDMFSLSDKVTLIWWNTKFVSRTTVLQSSSQTQEFLNSWF